MGCPQKSSRHAPAVVTQSRQKDDQARTSGGYAPGPVISLGYDFCATRFLAKDGQCATFLTWRASQVLPTRALGSGDFRRASLRFATSPKSARRGTIWRAAYPLLSGPKPQETHFILSKSSSLQFVNYFSPPIIQDFFTGAFAKFLHAHILHAFCRGFP